MDQRQRQSIAQPGKQRRQTDPHEPIGRAQLWPSLCEHSIEEPVAQEGVLGEELILDHAVSTKGADVELARCAAGS
jgi:hypothetical protein